MLFASDFSTNSDGWKFLGGGDWKVQDGALRQTAEKEFVRAVAGDKSWTDYTLELKARKMGGREGFLVLFHISNNQDRVWWNIGGWNDTQNAVELDETMDAKAGYIETGRWYDIKIEVRGISIKCWLDGKLIHEILKPRQTTHRLYASATHDSKTGDIILKVVNAANTPVSAEIELQGAQHLSGTGRSIVLTSDSPWDENSLEEPAKVSPQTGTFDFLGGNLHRTFPGNWVTVLRIGTK